MKSLILTNEYPPNIYGGAGIHAAYLTRELAKLCDVDVRCFGEQSIDAGSLQVKGYGLNGARCESPKGLRPVFGALERCLDFNKAGIDADVVHVHTWYAHFGGILAKLNYSIPLILTAHSLEPLRPWKRDQLGAGYDFSSWVERSAIEMADAVVAVSESAKEDVLKFFNVDGTKVHAIYNGIDADEYKPVKSPATLRRFGIDPKKPYVFFLGRLTQQKGAMHFIDAIKYMNPGYQVVICGGTPDTEEMQRSVRYAITKAQSEREGIFWIGDVNDMKTKCALYSHAAVFCCPSIYEPFGIINLEAMACETAVVASAVGGIREVVVHGGTGYLVPVKQHRTTPYEPVDPERFSSDLAARINELIADKHLRDKMGRAGRRRASEIFSWTAVAKKTVSLYESLLPRSAKRDRESAAAVL